ncbi:hypothetical protein [Acetohalobium arabaticum]|uniref:hypothetical protein n=1 Tax=Acetohalobium arabaticum TaxID=28187 RepID=UPI0002DAC798|nr:hypothetical protein [Acetohalobium arabaticum]
MKLGISMPSSSLLSKLTTALIKDGVMYISVKYGDQEIKRDDGRLFNYYNDDTFLKLQEKIENLKVLKMWKTVDVRQNREDEYWLNVLMRKK